MLKPSILHSIVSLCGEEEAIGVFIDVCPSIEEAAHYRFRQMICSGNFTRSLQTLKEVDADAGECGDVESSEMSGGL